MTPLEALVSLGSGGLGAAVATGLARWATRREARLEHNEELGATERSRLVDVIQRQAMALGASRAELAELKGDLAEKDGEILALRARLERLAKSNPPKGPLS